MEAVQEESFEWLVDLAGTRAVLDELPYGVAVIEAQGRCVVYRNEEARRLAAKHGWPEEIFYGEGRFWLLRPDGSALPDEEQPVKRALEQEKRASSTPLLVPCVDGTALALLIDATPLFDDGGRLVGARINGREIVDPAERARLFSSQNDARLGESGCRLLAMVDETSRYFTSPDEMVQMATHLVGRHLRANCCDYATVDLEMRLLRIFKGFSCGVAPKQGNYPLARFEKALALLRQGDTVTVSDTRQDPRTAADYAKGYGPLDIGALIAVPLVRDGRLKAIFAAGQAGPRAWTDQEVRLMEAVAGRTWMMVEHLETQRALREREATFRELVEGMPNLVWNLHMDGGLRFIGPQWREYTGIEDDPGRPEIVARYVHPDDLPRVRQAWYHALNENRPYEVEVRYRRADGAYRYFISRSRPVRGESGRIVEWIGTSTDIHDLRVAQKALEERTHQLARAQTETFDRLIRVASLRDSDTANHTWRVGHQAEQIALRLGHTPDDAAELGRAARLHDLGKIGIPDAILHKPGRLTEEERRTMETHTTLGASLLKGGESSLLRRATTIALSHHERWDGFGYPCGLPADRIPLDGRIVAVADAYDAMTNDRPYRRALPRDEARSRLDAGRGSQWDASVVDAFLLLDDE